MAARWQIYEQGNELLRQLAEQAGVQALGHFYIATAGIQQLGYPQEISLVRPRRDGREPVQRTVTIPVGWFEAVTFVSDTKDVQLAWRTFGPTYERTRRKSEYKLLAFVLREHAAGRWPT